MRSLAQDRAAASQASLKRSPWTRVGQVLPRGVVILLTALVIFTPPSTIRSTSVGLVNSSITRSPAYFGLL